MPYPATVYQILIASPSDCIEERHAIPEVIYSWNACNSDAFRVVLLPVMWETHSWPELGDRAQSIINKQVVKNCDILIGAFWTRLGTPTGVSESGTVEEIDSFRKMEKPVMLYFSEKPIEPRSIDQEQLARLRKFKDKCRKEGLFHEYKSIEELRVNLMNHLTRVVRDLHKIPEESGKKKTNESSETTIETFLKKLNRLYAEWNAEKPSKDSSLYVHEPGIDSAQLLLRKLDEILLDFRTDLIDNTVEVNTLDKIDGILKKSKLLQKLEEFDTAPSLTGTGVEYKNVWLDGDLLFSQIIDLALKLSKNSSS